MNRILSLAALLCAALSLAAQPRVVVNEVMVANIDRILDPSFNYGGWVELYNCGDEEIPLSGCRLNGHNMVEAGTIEPHGFYTVWLDHCNLYFPRQVDFKLEAEGGVLTLAAPDGSIILQQEYPASVPRCSWGRKIDGEGEEWSFTSQPTPGETNATSEWADSQVEAPTVDVAGKLFTGSVEVHASWPKGSTLRYTLDGSVPTAENGATSDDGVFRIDDSSCLRLCAVHEGMLPSAVVTNSYINNEDYKFTIPVLSITTPHDGLYGDDYGIFVRGNGNGRSGRGEQEPCNWNQDWDRACTMEYFMPSGERVFVQDADICAAGGRSRRFEPHSFKLKASKTLGKSTFDYPFFSDKPYNKHKTLLFRNGGNDYTCRFKDAAIQTVVIRSGLYIDAQAYQPVAHFINGRYIGVINMREPNNKRHAYSNYGYDADEIDQFEMSPDSGYVQSAGTKEAFNTMLQLSERCADPEVYQTICDEYLDIDEYCNYMAVCFYLGNSDWMNNNVKAYRSRTGDGRFHYVLMDTELSFGYSHTKLFDRLEKEWAYKEVEMSYIPELDTRLTVPFENVNLWMNLLQNDDFRKRFTDTYSIVCGSVFEFNRCRAVLDELYNRVEPMMKLERKSAYESYNHARMCISSSRASVQINNLANYHKFYDETEKGRSITFSANIPEATILYNGIEVPTGSFDGRVYLPVTLTACVPGGYEFEGWAYKGGGTITTETSLSLAAMTSGTQLETRFIKKEEEKHVPVRINEVSAANKTYASDLFKRSDWLELYNTTGEDIDIAGMYLTDNIDKPHKYQIPDRKQSGIKTVIPAHGHILVWCDKQEASSQLHAPFKLDGDADACIRLTASDDSWSDTFYYPAHDFQHTAGRFPDGSDTVCLMTLATPNAPNRQTTYTTFYNQSNIIADATPLSSADLKIHYDGTHIITTQEACIEIFNLSGKKLTSASRATTLPISHLRPGIYVARAEALGKTCTIKFKK